MKTDILKTKTNTTYQYIALNNTKITLDPVEAI